jgi:hypothetical protein
MIEGKTQPNDRFEIGGEDLLAPTPAESIQAGAAAQDAPPQPLPRETLDDIRVRVGTLLKTETVSFLLGAGASVDCGGQLIGAVPLAVERDLLEKGITGSQKPRIRRWLVIFYVAVRHCAGHTNTPVTRDEIVDRRATLNGADADRLPANFGSFSTVCFANCFGFKGLAGAVWL